MLPYSNYSIITCFFVVTTSNISKSDHSTREDNLRFYCSSGNKCEEEFAINKLRNGQGYMMSLWFKLSLLC